MSARSKRKIIVFAICFIVCLCFVLYIYILNSQKQQTQSYNSDTALSVTVIDVGQGDSILVTLGEDTMLIDAASKSDSEAVLGILNQQKIADIDILVATHPHEDHIGGLSSVIDSYDIGTVYMADTGSGSKTFSKLIDAIESKSIPLIEAYAGLEFYLGAAVCTIVSPARGADLSANNESIVIFLDYYDSEFLFTGDIEQRAEKELIISGYDFDADVLKVAHHGSSTGTCEEFLKIVSPDYAVISCGEGNSYGHPHESTLDLLLEYGAKVYRTDVSGDIKFITDGRTIQVKP